MLAKQCGTGVPPVSGTNTVGRGVPLSAEDFFAYTYAVLSAPAYVETFSEELTLPGPHLPVTRDSALFARAVTHGRHLLWLHSYGERFVPARQKSGRLNIELNN